nr:phage tail protein [uncultured Holophaga sp.]
MVWWFVVYLAVAVASALLTKAPAGAEASSLSSSDIPSPEEGAEIPIVLGTCKIDASNVTWWGAFKAVAIKVSTGGFLGIGAKKYTTGYKYYLGMQMSLSGEIDALVDIVVDSDTSLADAGVTMPSYSATGATIAVNLPDLFGGTSSSGGLQGDIDFYWGSGSQGSNDYLTDQIGEQAPGWRGVAYAVLKDFYIGTSAYPKSLAWVVRHCPVPSGLLSENANISGAANPAHAIAYILTGSQSVGCLGLSSTRLDTTAFKAAAATLYSEGIGVSMLLDSSQSASQWIQGILQVVDGVLFTDPSTGLWTFNLVRDDYDEDELLHLTRSDVSGVQIKIPSWPETVNRVAVRYTDRDAGFVTKTCQGRDTANRTIQGTDVAKTIDYAAVDNASTAQYIADRDVRQLSYPLVTGSLNCNRKAWALRPGGAFKLTHDTFGLDAMVMRVTAIRYGSLEDGKIYIEFAEDVFGAVEAVGTPAESGWSNPLVAPSVCTLQAMFEAPYACSGFRDVFLVGARADQVTQTMDTYLSTDGTTWDQGADLVPTPTGLLVSAYTAKTAALDSTVGFTVGSGVDLSRLPGESTTGSGLYRGENIAILVSSAGNEWISWKTCTSNGDGTYAFTGILRGILDTVPCDHAAGDRVWFLSEGAVLAYAGTESSTSGSSASAGANGTDGTSIIWRGDYDGTEIYEAQDAVAHAGSSWICLQECSGQTPADPSAYWDLLAEAGTDGEDGASGLQSRSTASVTTATLAASATGSVSLTLPKGCDIYAIETDYPAWVRLYSSDAARTSDASRSATTRPTAGTGIFLDEVTTSSKLKIWSSPVPKFVNPAGENTAYLSITNNASSLEAITVTITYIQTEAS